MKKFHDLDFRLTSIRPRTGLINCHHFQGQGTSTVEKVSANSLLTLTSMTNITG